jgi:hypothetical protein
MMNLFTITESFDVELNKEWIVLIPEFNAILKADKGSVGDSEGRKKLKARKQLAYVYFMVDFRSPIYGYEFVEKQREALRYTGLKASDVEITLVQEAKQAYEKMQKEQARSLRTLEAAQKGMNALDDYMSDIDFTAIDKMGKLLNSPKEFVDNLKNLNKAYDELAKFEKRVYEDLKENSTIRGNATLGDRERAKTETSTWEEGTDDSVARVGNNFSDMTHYINKVKAKKVEDEEED